MRWRGGPLRAPTLTRTLIVLSILTLGCGGAPSVSRDPILLFAIDGLEWNLVLPLLRSGQLPNIAAIMESGNYGLLATTRPTFSPIIWTSVATGKTPDQHGIRGFVRRAGPDRDRRLFNNQDRKTKAFWNILSDYDRSVAIVGWWMTHPVEAVNGVMVAQVNTLGQADRDQGRAILKGGLVEGTTGQVHPADRLERYLDLHDRISGDLPEIETEIFGEFTHRASPLAERLWLNTRWSLRSDSTYLEIAVELAAEGTDLLAVYLGGADVVAHRFWRHMEPESFEHPPSAEEVEDFGSLIPDYYRFIDRSIGRVAARMPAGTRTIIVSDHGMHAVNKRKAFRPDNIPKDLNSAHHRDAPPGVVIAAGPGIRAPGRATDLATLRRSDLSEIGSILDVTPTILALAGIPIGEDMVGRPMRALLARALADPATVPSHDNEAWITARAALQPEGLEANDERMEQLRALGYVN